MNRLNLEKGEVDIEGEIASMDYSDVQGLAEKKNAFLGRLFQ